MSRRSHNGVTFLELLVVLVVISILSTIAAGVYSKEVLRAKYATTKSEIRSLEVAIAQYEADTGQLPPSGSGNPIAPGPIQTVGTALGSGYLQLALRSSLNGDFRNPLSTRWIGPYINWEYSRMGSLDGTPVNSSNFSGSQGQVNFLDPYGSPYFYIRAEDYATRGGTELPGNSVFYATERYFNPSTFQLISLGPNRESLATPQRGLDGDDITNFDSRID